MQNSKSEALDKIPYAYIVKNMEQDQELPYNFLHYQELPYNFLHWPEDNKMTWLFKYLQTE